MELIDRTKLEPHQIYDEDGWVEVVYMDDIREMPAIDAEPKRELEVTINEACLDCELDCVEVVRCHDCENYEEAKNGCNGFCKEWNTSTYSWEWCSRRSGKEEEDERYCTICNHFVDCFVSNCGY